MRGAFIDGKNIIKVKKMGARKRRKTTNYQDPQRAYNVHQAAGYELEGRSDDYPIDGKLHLDIDGSKVYRTQFGLLWSKARKILGAKK